MRHHPDACARLLRPRSTWRDPRETRGDRDFEALDWRDAALALGGCRGLAFDAFAFRFSENAPSRALIEHLLAVARAALNGSDKATPQQLVEILLREERAPESQRTERHRHLACGVTRHVWRYHLARPYAAIGQALDVLVSDAWRVARSRLDAA